MKIVLVTYHYPPEVSGGVARCELMEKFLVGAGHEVTVVSPQDLREGCGGARHISVPKSLTPSIYGRLRDFKSSSLGRTFPVNLAYSLRRALLCFPDPMRQWSERAARVVAGIFDREKADILFTTSPADSTHIVGEWLKRRFSFLWIADFRDGWTFEPHRWEASLPIRRTFERAMEERILLSADMATFATSPLMRDVAERMPSISGKLRLLPTGFAEFAPKTAYKRDGARFEIVYTGRFSFSDTRRDPTVFFRALRKVVLSHGKNRVGVTMLGDYSPRERELWRDPELKGVVSELPPVPHAEALERCAMADALLLVTPPNQISISTRKIFDYLSVKRPIFALAEGNEAAAIIASTKSGVCVSPSDADAVAEGLLVFASLWDKGVLEKAYPCSGAGEYSADRILAKFFDEIAKSYSHRNGATG